MEDRPQPPANGAKPRQYPFRSPLYSIAQMLSVLLTLNVTLPAVLQVSWSGSMLEQGVFLLLFSTAFIVVSFLFLAVAGYLAIMLVVARNLRKITLTDARNEDVAKAIAIRVLLGNQPRWLISLTPCVVPALTFALISMFYKDKLSFDDGMQLFQACLLLGLTSFIMCLPFILRTQKIFGTQIIGGIKDRPSDGNDV